MSQEKQWVNKPLRILDFKYLIRMDTYDNHECVNTCKELHPVETA